LRRLNGVPFYLYTADLQALQTHLRADGQAADAIRDGSPGRARRCACVIPTATCSWSPSASEII
jgi:hypothetical protein